MVCFFKKTNYSCTFFLAHFQLNLFFLVGYHQRLHGGARIPYNLNFLYYFPKTLALVGTISKSRGPASSSLTVLQTHNQNHQSLNLEIEGHSLPLTLWKCDR